MLLIRIAALLRLIRTRLAGLREFHSWTCLRLLAADTVQLLLCGCVSGFRRQDLLPSLKGHGSWRGRLLDDYLPVHHRLRRPARGNRAAANHALAHGSDGDVALDFRVMQLALIHAHRSRTCRGKRL